MIQQLFIFNRADVSSILDFYAEKKKTQRPQITKAHRLANTVLTI